MNGSTPLDELRAFVDPRDEEDDPRLLFSAFEELNTGDYWREPMQNLMAKYDISKRERPTLDNFRRKLRDARVEVQLANAIIDKLKLPEHALLEKANLFIFSRSWSGVENEAFEQASEIAAESAAYLRGGRSEAPG